MAKNPPLLVDIGQGLSILMGLPTIASWNTEERPKTARAGTFGFNVKTKCLEFWDGKNWYASRMA